MTPKKEDTDGGHSKLGGSGAKRFMACPGSVALCADIPNVESDYAKEGTAAHSLGAATLLHGYTKVYGLSNEGLVKMGHVPEDEIIWVNDEMRGYVKEYVDAVLDIIGAPTLNKKMFVEKEVSLAHIHPEMRGTADAVAGLKKEKTLHVIDLKYGAGVAVEVEKNPQGMYYALGALALPEFIDWEFDTVVITIIQPRKEHRDGPVRSFTISVKDLVAWGENELKPAAIATEDPFAPLVAGEWCRGTFCSAMATCPQIRDEAFALAKVEFKDLDKPEGITLPDKASLSTADLAKLLTFSKLFIKWAEGVETHAKTVLTLGGKIPGLKLIQSVGNRVFTNPEGIKELLVCLGHAEEDLMEPAKPAKLKSLAQIEKKVGKKAIVGLWHKPITGTKVVLDSVKGTVVTSEFTNLDKIQGEK